MAGPLAAARPTEPSLAAEDIQGNVVPGFATRHQALVFFSVTDPIAAADWLGSLRVTNCADVAGGRADDTWVNVALSHAGLAIFVEDAGRLTDIAFKQGLCRRSVSLGDPESADAEGNPRNWVVGGRRDDHDVLVILGDDDPIRLTAHVGALCREPPAGLRRTFVQLGGELRPPMTGREAFGFCDNLSQPILRGWPAAPEPGRKAVWPGEFVFGYPRQDPLDSVAPGPVETGGVAWARNGSLLVFRRLRQEVVAFRAFVTAAAAELATRSGGLAGLTPDRLAAKLMGRWASGAPLLRAPDADLPGIGRDPAVRNAFGYLGDAEGLICPRAAHIRRAYPRDAAASGLTEAAVETHRLLRRSVPYGDPVRTPEQCGLLFLAYQTSIERQFEFVTRAWLNVADLHDVGDGQDPIVGQRFGARGDRKRLFTIAVAMAGGGVERIPLTVPQDWVVPTGGGYFFVPSLTTLAEVIGRHRRRGHRG